MAEGAENTKIHMLFTSKPLDSAVFKHLRKGIHRRYVLQSHVGS